MTGARSNVETESSGKMRNFREYSYGHYRAIYSIRGASTNRIYIFFKLITQEPLDRFVSNFEWGTQYQN